MATEPPNSLQISVAALLAKYSLFEGEAEAPAFGVSSIHVTRVIMNAVFHDSPNLDGFIHYGLHWSGVLN